MSECRLHCKEKDEETEDFCELIRIFEGILNEKRQRVRSIGYYMLCWQERKMRIFICVCLVFTIRNRKKTKNQ